jgi:hypothetical protein
LGVEIGPVIEHRRKKIKFKNFWVIIEVEIEEEIDKGRGGSNLAKNERNLKFKNDFKTNSQVRN